MTDENPECLCIHMVRRSDATATGRVVGKAFALRYPVKDDNSDLINEVIRMISKARTEDVDDDDEHPHLTRTTRTTKCNSIRYQMEIIKMALRSIESMLPEEIKYEG